MAGRNTELPGAPAACRPTQTRLRHGPAVRVHRAWCVLPAVAALGVLTRGGLRRAITAEPVVEASTDLAALLPKQKKPANEEPAMKVPKGPWRAAAVGSGSWGNTVAMMIAENTRQMKGWVSEVRMQIYDEIMLTQEDMYGMQDLHKGKNGSFVSIPEGGFGTRLSKIINTQHENIKYLPGVTLPDNLMAEPDMETAVSDADVVVVGVPDQFIIPTCAKMKPFLKKSARLILLAKGVEFHGSRLLPVTEVVAHELEFPSSQICVLMGANIAREVAFKQFSESTFGCKNADDLQWLRPVIARPFFPIATVRNVEGPQMCGALKNVVAIGKGLLDGMGMSSNTVSALMRVGMKEMKSFILEFFQVPDLVFWESCCFADLITTCMSGRNQLVAGEFARRQGTTSFETLEREMLDGQRLQGTITSVPVHNLLVKMGWLKKYPLFEGVYQVVAGKAKAAHILEVLQAVPQTDSTSD